MPPRAPSPAALRALRSLAFPTITTTRTAIRPRACAPTSSHRNHLPRAYSGTHPHHPPPSPAQQRGLKLAAGQTNPHAPRHSDRGPVSSETTQTDFSAMDIFNSSATPQAANAIDACTPTGFHLSNGLKTTNGAGLLLLGGEAFAWRPWTTVASPSSSNTTTTTTTSSAGAGGGEASLRDKKGMLVLPPATLALLNHLYPRPDLLILGTGQRMLPLHPTTRNYLMTELGMRVDVMDTANASAAYNLLATERGLEAGGVGAALFPISWRG